MLSARENTLWLGPLRRCVVLREAPAAARQGMRRAAAPWWWKEVGDERQGPLRWASERRGGRAAKRHGGGRRWGQRGEDVHPWPVERMRNI
jgi:hypothetical protein